MRPRLTHVLTRTTDDAIKVTIYEFPDIAVSPGLLQTADYARHMFLRYADLQGSVRDTDAAVRVRQERQRWLYTGGHKFHALIWEAALHALICPRPSWPASSAVPGRSPRT
ncbi:Scr1 family TA system antitoxin-like transcriptional regulator [Streptomyces phaeochromogenes]|uniref:Scr1 family TA system antitoxin-like transcriptional regulator n=1 Tax=Streptomyces phaeochromogenes TaxID=1923 RepID=UPI00386C51A8